MRRNSLNGSFPWLERAELSACPVQGSSLDTVAGRWGEGWQGERRGLARGEEGAGKGSCLLLSARTLPCPISALPPQPNCDTAAPAMALVWAWDTASLQGTREPPQNWHGEGKLPGSHDCIAHQELSVSSHLQCPSKARSRLLKNSLEAVMALILNTLFKTWRLLT